ncbi:MAG: 50S ribosomal protein L25/general stress protein Ctc [Micrococcales bacterium]|nr:50S ribosomal protein L25/general stress protein Ctc [Micrococcales bacterium]
MSDNVRLAAKPRTEFGKGAARRTRREKLIPATIHGHPEPPIHISLPEHATRMALRQANVLLEIEIEGVKNQTLALAREIQRNPVRDTIIHVDLRSVKKGQRIEVEVPVRVEGEPASGIAILDTQMVRIMAEATSLPESIIVDVAGRTEGNNVFARDLVLSEGAELVGDPDAIIVTISLVRADIDEVEEGAGDDDTEAEAEAEAEA